MAAVGVTAKKTYFSLESNQISQVEDFQYDKGGTLQKRSRYVGNREKIIEYDEFKYDDNGVIVNKLTYVKTRDSGFVLLKLKAYRYSNGLLISEKESFPLAQYFDDYEYEYKDGVLISKLYYSRDSLINKTVYKYENGRLKNETLYDKQGKMFHSIEHIYRNDTLIETKHFIISGELLKTIVYSYNKAGQLEVENMEIKWPYSSESPHVIRYEY